MPCLVILALSFLITHIYSLKFLFFTLLLKYEPNISLCDLVIFGNFKGVLNCGLRTGDPGLNPNPFPSFSLKVSLFFSINFVC